MVRRHEPHERRIQLYRCRAGASADHRHDQPRHRWRGHRLVRTETNNDIDQATKLVMAEAEPHPGFTFAIMIDQGAIQWYSCSGCSPQQALVSDLQYLEQTYFPSPGVHDVGRDSRSSPTSTSTFPTRSTGMPRVRALQSTRSSFFKTTRLHPRSERRKLFLGHAYDDRLRNELPRQFLQRWDAPSSTSKPSAPPIKDSTIPWRPGDPIA